MTVHSARIPENLEEYLRLVIETGHADSFGAAINLIVLERMMADRDAGIVRPFKYRLKDGRKGNASVNLGEINTDNVDSMPGTFPLGEPPAIGGPDPGRYAETSPSHNGGFAPPSKPKYPGTMAEYLKEPYKSRFLPPDE